LGRVVLAADVVPVGPGTAAVVDRIDVAANDAVEAGTELLRVTAGGQRLVLTAPVTGRVAVVNVARGDLTSGDRPMIVLRDETRLTFQAEITADQVRRLRLGMTTYVEGAGLPVQISARLDRVLPAAGEPSDRPTVVLTPTDPDTIRNLTAGRIFTARVDTDTAPGAAWLAAR
jgi:multidrug resistance efflux pump